MRASIATLATALALLPAGVAVARTPPPQPDYHYAVPVQQSSPWPTMRHDLRNTGSSPIVGRYPGGRPWAFRTGKGIFSTPVVEGDGTILFGSADTYFYAVGPTGKLRWTFKTGNLIDSAGFVGAYSSRWRTYPVAVPSGDDYLYLVRSDDRRLTNRQRVIWRYKAPARKSPLGSGQLVNWWEGNAEPGPDGTIFAGNTGDAAFALHPNGSLKWVQRSVGPFWTDPAIERDGTTFWGSLDLQVHAFWASGASRWSLPTGGFVVSSPALDRAGTLFVGSFDSKLYAIDAATGRKQWTFSTGGHIYSSPALDEDAGGRLHEVVIASTDGRIYALAPSGRELWSYDTGDVIRSSPVIGLAPDGVHKIVYVGADDGTIYALNAATGARRWSYDTTSRDPIIGQRNDLNGSPALTPTGITIGGEDGDLHFVPYDYCLHHRDSRCSTSGGQAFPRELNRLFAVGPGGNTLLAGGTETISPGAVLPIRLVVRHAGQTLNAAMVGFPNAASLVHLSPAVPFTAELSGDGRYLFVVPDGSLRPGSALTVRVGGRYATGGSQTGSFAGTLRYRVTPAGGPLPLRTGAGSVSALRLTRLAFPLPAFLTSVNQIGFDAYDLIVGALRVTGSRAGKGSLLLWAVGARPGANGVEEVDPSTTLGFPLGGSFARNSVLVGSENSTLTFSFGPVPSQRLVMRAQLSPSGATEPGASVYTEVQCAAVPTYGPLLPAQHLCNGEGKLVASGTFETSGYARAGRANQRPAGVTVSRVTMRRPTALGAGSVTAALRLAPRASLPAGHHLLSILLVDRVSGQPVGLDYRARTTQVTDGRGNIVGARLNLPAGTQLPSALQAYVISDVFPLAERAL